MTRWVQIALHAVIGGSAVVAGLTFIRDSSGRSLGMTTEWLEGSPFPDFRVPGLFLAVVIGGTNLVSAIALLRRHRLAAPASFATGMLLVAWIAIQTAIIGLRHWTQAFWWATFVLMALFGGRLLREDAGKRRERIDE